MYSLRDVQLTLVILVGFFYGEGGNNNKNSNIKNVATLFLLLIKLLLFFRNYLFLPLCMSFACGIQRVSSQFKIYYWHIQMFVRNNLPMQAPFATNIPR